MRWINLHTHHFTGNPDVLEVVNQYPREFDAKIPYFSIGIHPWYIDENRFAEDLKIVEAKLQLGNCIALGECGLDKRIEMPFDLQMEAFEAQLILAEKFQKPVIIHCVAAFSELIQVKKKFKISVPMIIHGFSKNEQTAKQLLDKGFYLSFGRYLLRNPELESVFKSVPDDRFFLETDTVSESIAEVYTLAAKYKNIKIKDVKTLVENNFTAVFTNKQIND